MKKSIALVVVAFFTTSVNAAEPIASFQVGDPEFIGHNACYQGDDYLAYTPIDPITGKLLEKQEVRYSVRSVPRQIKMNGPEPGEDASGKYCLGSIQERKQYFVYYFNDQKGVIFPNSNGLHTPFAPEEICDPSRAVMGNDGKGTILIWGQKPIKLPPDAAAGRKRWLSCTEIIISRKRDGLWVYDLTTNTTHRLLNREKRVGQMDSWNSPDLGRAIAVVTQEKNLSILLETPQEWQIFKTISSPLKEYPYIYSPEGIAWKDQSWVVFVVSKAHNKTVSDEPSVIVLYNISTDQYKFFGNLETNNRDPEVLALENDMLAIYWFDGSLETTVVERVP